MRRRVLIILSITLHLAFFSGCKNFQGFGNPGDTFASDHNLPGQHIVPYSNPDLLYKQEKEVDACQLVETAQGRFACL